MSLDTEVKLLVILIGIVAVEVSNSSSLNTKFVVNRDNSTFEIILLPPRECPEKYYLYKAKHGEFFLDDGRDVTKESTKLCIKCSKCLDGIEVVAHCSASRDVLCGKNCVESGFRFDEGTQSCQHEKILDEGYTHDELRKWQEEQEKIQNLVTEVGSTSKSKLTETQTDAVTEHRHQGFQKTVGGVSQTSTSPPQTSDEIVRRLFDEPGSDQEEILEEEQMGENLPRPAVSDHMSRLQHMLLIVLIFILVITVSLYVFAAVRKFRPGLCFGIMARRRQLRTPLMIGLSRGRVPRAVTVLPSLRSSTRSGEEPQPPDNGSSSDGSYEDSDDNDGDIGDNEENGVLGGSKPNSPLCHARSDDTDSNDDDIRDNEDESVESVEPSIQIHNFSTGSRDVIGNVILHDVDSIQCGDKGSTVDICSPQSRNIDNKLGREEDKAIDNVSNTGPTGNEDSLKDEICMGDEVEVHPSLEKETPFIDSVIKDDDAHNEGLATVTEEDINKVSDFYEVCFSYDIGDRDRSPSDLNDVTDKSIKAEENAGLNTGVSSVEYATVSDPSQVSGLLPAVNQLKDLKQPFRKAEVFNTTARGTANPPHVDIKRGRSRSTSANWMSEVHKDYEHLDPLLSRSKEFVIDDDFFHGYENKKRNTCSFDLNKMLTVNDESDELKKEMKIEHDRNDSKVENASYISAALSPRSLEAGGNQGGGVKTPVCNFERILVTECEISHETGNRPHTMTKRRSSSCPNSIGWPNRNTPRCHSAPGALNQMDRKWTSDMYGKGRQAKKGVDREDYTKVSTSEDASLLNAPKSPRSLEAGGYKGIGVKNPVCNSERKLMIKFHEFSREVGINRRCRSFPTRVFLEPDVTMAGIRWKGNTTEEMRLTLNPLLAPIDLNQMNRKMKNDKIYQQGPQMESQSLLMTDTQFCRCQKTQFCRRQKTKSKIHRFGSNAHGNTV